MNFLSPTLIFQTSTFREPLRFSAGGAICGSVAMGAVVIRNLGKCDGGSLKHPSLANEECPVPCGLPDG